MEPVKKHHHHIKTSPDVVAGRGSNGRDYFEKTRPCHSFVNLKGSRNRIHDILYIRYTYVY